MKNFEKKYLKIAKEIVLSEIDKNKTSVFLFGPRAYGNDKHASDIDIGLLSNEEIKSYVFTKIANKLAESIVPYHFDLIDFNKVEEKFKKDALKDCIIWNKAKELNIN